MPGETGWFLCFPLYFTVFSLGLAFWVVCPKLCGMLREDSPLLWRTHLHRLCPWSAGKKQKGFSQWFWLYRCPSVPHQILAKPSASLLMLLQNECRGIMGTWTQALPWPLQQWHTVSSLHAKWSGPKPLPKGKRWVTHGSGLWGMGVRTQFLSGAACTWMGHGHFCGIFQIFHDAGGPQNVVSG